MSIPFNVKVVIDKNSFPVLGNKSLVVFPEYKDGDKPYLILKGKAQIKKANAFMGDATVNKDVHIGLLNLSDGLSYPVFKGLYMDSNNKLNVSAFAEAFESVMVNPEWIAVHGLPYYFEKNPDLFGHFSTLSEEDKKKITPYTSTDVYKESFEYFEQKSNYEIWFNRDFGSYSFDEWFEKLLEKLEKYSEMNLLSIPAIPGTVDHFNLMAKMISSDFPSYAKIGTFFPMGDFNEEIAEDASFS